MIEAEDKQVISLNKYRLFSVASALRDAINNVYSPDNLRRMIDGQLLKLLRLFVLDADSIRPYQTRVENCFAVIQECDQDIAKHKGLILKYRERLKIIVAWSDDEAKRLCLQERLRSVAESEDQIVEIEQQKQDAIGQLKNVHIELHDRIENKHKERFIVTSNSCGYRAFK